MTTERTVQLRRYRIGTGEMAAFVAWFRERLLPAREAFGFALDFAVIVPETDEFVWAVSAEGDTETFAMIDTAWTESPERAAVFEGVPQRVASMDLRMATPV